VAALDDRITETLNRLLDSVRGQLESELGSYRDELIRTANEATAQVAIDAAAQATAEARLEAERELTEVRDTSARTADEQRSHFTEEIKSLQHQLDEAHSETAAAREQIESLTAELDEARKQLDLTRDDVEATLRTIESSRQESEATRLR